VSDKTRREFLKSCFRIGGYAGIACLGMGAIEDARGWGILPAIVGSGGSNVVSWADWPEDDESTLATADTFCMLFENPSDGGDETGQGSTLTGADLIFTSAGDAPGMPGATGSPPSRLLDGTSDYGDLTPALVNSLLSGKTTYTLCMKINVGAGYDDIDTFIYFSDGATDAQIQLDIRSTKIRCGLYDLDNGYDGLDTTDAITTGSIIYMCVFCDGVATRFGWTVGTKPTKLSDFAAGKIKTATNLYDNFGTFTTTTLFQIGGRFLPGSAYFFVMSNKCLITT